MGVTVSRYRIARRRQRERPWHTAGALIGLLWFLVGIVAVAGHVHRLGLAAGALLIASLACSVIGLLRGEPMFIGARRYRQAEDAERPAMDGEQG
jgi:hypothetical protein